MTCRGPNPCPGLLFLKASSRRPSVDDPLVFCLPTRLIPPADTPDAAAGALSGAKAEEGWDKDAGSNTADRRGRRAEVAPPPALAEHAVAGMRAPDNEPDILAEKADLARPEGLEVPDAMRWPRTQRQFDVLERTAKFLAPLDAQMEILLRTKQAANPWMRFLEPGHRLNPFYRHVKQLIVSGSYTPRPRDNTVPPAATMPASEPRPEQAAATVEPGAGAHGKTAPLVRAKASRALVAYDSDDEEEAAEEAEQAEEEAVEGEAKEEQDEGEALDEKAEAVDTGSSMEEHNGRDRQDGATMAGSATLGTEATPLAGTASDTPVLESAAVASAASVASGRSSTEAQHATEATPCETAAGGGDAFRPSSSAGADEEESPEQKSPSARPPSSTTAAQPAADNARSTTAGDDATASTAAFPTGTDAMAANSETVLAPALSSHWDTSLPVASAPAPALAPPASLGAPPPPPATAAQPETSVLPVRESSLAASDSHYGPSWPPHYHHAWPQAKATRNAIIVPPPDIKTIVDKIAQYVARNGKVSATREAVGRLQCRDEARGSTWRGRRMHCSHCSSAFFGPLSSCPLPLDRGRHWKKLSWPSTLRTIVSPFSGPGMSSIATTATC